MFARLLHIDRIGSNGSAEPCPIKWIDSFAMRNFTNDAIFDDTLPLADGLMEAGHRIPLAMLHAAMEDWFRRKGYLAAADSLRITEEPVLPSGVLRTVLGAE